MRIVVASGKGGTGKTTVATSLALSAGDSVRFMDCDVEAPNAALFLNPNLDTRKEVGILLPVVDEALCTHCGKCAEVCEFHAIAVIGKKTLVFPELCHGCGSCTLVCPEKAISERLDVMGVLESGLTATGMDFAQGVMNVGEPMAVPIIRELKKWNPMSLRASAKQSPLIEEEIASGKNAPRNDIEIRDAPPGASCPVVETMRGADFILLVTEPTPFGLHDLKQVVGITRELGIPAGVVVNRDGIGDNAVEAYCAEAGLPILLRIPMERRFAEAIASGRTLVDAAPEYRAAFQTLLQDITARVAA
jgi:MinD superfamily P-loop ATPase